MNWHSPLGLLLLTLICLPTAVGALRSAAREAPVLLLGWEGVVQQARPNYCGAAVIAMLLQRGGVRVSQLEVVESARITAGGITLGEFERLAQGYGLRGGWFETRDESLIDMVPLPAVVHLRGEAGHFAIVERTLDGFVQLADPARGRLLLGAERFEREWTGRIFVFRGAG